MEHLGSGDSFRNANEVRGHHSSLLCDGNEKNCRKQSSHSIRDGNEKLDWMQSSSPIKDGNTKQDRMQILLSVYDAQAGWDSSSIGDGDEKQERNICSFPIEDTNGMQGRKKSSCLTEDGNERHARRPISSCIGNKREKQAMNQNSSSTGDYRQKKSKKHSSSLEDGFEKLVKNTNSPAVDGTEKDDRTKTSSLIGYGNVKQVQRMNFPIRDRVEKETWKQKYSTRDGNKQAGRNRNGDEAWKQKFSTGGGDEKRPRRDWNEKETTREWEKKETEKHNGNVNEKKTSRQCNEKEARKQKYSITDGNKKQTGRNRNKEDSWKQKVSIVDGNKKQDRRDWNEKAATREWNKKETGKQDYSSRNVDEKKASRKCHEKEARKQHFSSISDGPKKEAWKQNSSAGDGIEKKTQCKDYSTGDRKENQGSRRDFPSECGNDKQSRRPNCPIGDNNVMKIRSAEHYSIPAGIKIQTSRLDFSNGTLNEAQARRHDSLTDNGSENKTKRKHSSFGELNEKQVKWQKSQWGIRADVYSSRPLTELHTEFSESSNEVAGTQRSGISISLEEGNRESKNVQKVVNHLQSFVDISTVSENCVPANEASGESLTQCMSIPSDEQKSDAYKKNTSEVDGLHQNMHHFGNSEGTKSDVKISYDCPKNELDLDVQETLSGSPIISHGMNAKDDDNKCNKETMPHLTKSEKHVSYLNSRNRDDQSRYRRNDHRSHSHEYRCRNRGLKQERRVRTNYDSQYHRSCSRDDRHHGTHHDPYISNRLSKSRRTYQKNRGVDCSSPKKCSKGTENSGSCRINAEYNNRARRDNPLGDGDLPRSRGCSAEKGRVNESKANTNHGEAFRNVNRPEKCIATSSLSNDGDTHIVDSQKEIAYELDMPIARRLFFDEDNTCIVDFPKECKCAIRSPLSNVDCSSESGHNTRKNGFISTSFSYVGKGDEQQGREFDSPSHLLEPQRQFGAKEGEDSLLQGLSVGMDLPSDPVEDVKATSFPSLVVNADSQQTQNTTDRSDAKVDCKGWVYADYGSSMLNPQLSVSRFLMADRNLKLNHMVKLDDRFNLIHVRLPHVSESLELERINKQSLPSMLMQNTEDLTIFNCRSVSSEDLKINKRVEYLMQGFSLVPGRENKIIMEALTNATNHGPLGIMQESDEEDGHAVHWTQIQPEVNDYCFWNSQIFKESNDAETIRLDNITFQSSFQTSQKWTARGGDWKLICELGKSDNPNGISSLSNHEKIVLNQSIPLCERRYHQHVSDPRGESSSYEVSNYRTLEVPHWAYGYWEETKGVCISTFLEKYKAIKTSTLCTHKLQMLTPRDGIQCDSSRMSDSNNAISFSVRKLDNTNSAEGVFPRKSQKHHGHERRLPSSSYLKLEHGKDQHVGSDYGYTVVDEEIHQSFKSAQKVQAKEDLNLDKGKWFYLDGLGMEVGPFTYEELELKAQDGLLYRGMSVYRKCDGIWVPSTVCRTHPCPSNGSRFTKQENFMEKTCIQRDNVVCCFHKLFPQFIGYMRGKLHEHVMKSYRKSDFSAMLHEGSRNCFIGKTSILGEFQLKNSSAQTASASLDLRFDQDSYAMIHKKMEISPSAVDDITDSSNNLIYMIEINREGKSWNLMECHLLMRVFRFLEIDLLSLVRASIICKWWRAVFINFKKEMIQIDFSSLGSVCSDDIFRSLTKDTQNVSRVILRGCTTLSPSVVKEYLHRLKYIEHVDTKGCDQLKQVTRYKYGTLDLHQKSTTGRPCNEQKSLSVSKQSKNSDGQRARRLNFTSMDVKRVKTSLAHRAHGHSDAFEVRSRASTQQLKSLRKHTKLGADGSHHKVVPKLYVRDEKHKQTYKCGSEPISLSSVKTDSSPSLDRKLESDMVVVLQYLKDPKVLAGRKVTSDGSRALAYLEIEDKLRRGLYPPTIRGFRTFKSDLLSVARMLFRGKDKEAGTIVLGHTFRLIAQLDEEFKCRDLVMSKPHKRKYEVYKSGSSIVGSKRRIENVTGELQIEKTKSNDEGKDDYNWNHKTGHCRTDEEEHYCSHRKNLDSEVCSEDPEDMLRQGKESLPKNEINYRIWGARMTRTSMVPRTTRKYELVEEYIIVADVDEVTKRMGVSLPKNYGKIVQAQEQNGIEFSHLEMPELRDHKPRKQVQYEVREQEVYGIDPYTFNLLMDSMPTNRLDFPDSKRHLVIEDLLKVLNQEARKLTGVGKAPTKFPLERVVNRALDECIDFEKRSFISALAKNMWTRIESSMNDDYVAYRKGLGVICNHPSGFEKDEFIVEFFGEVYPAWRWYEKQDAIRAFQKQDKEAAPEFYNIFLERPKGDALGYDLVVVDAMHKANYASRICHSCRPNCEARVTAVNGKYQIGVYTLRPVDCGEELTFDYNSITESKEEHEKSVCLCGSHVCRGSYLNFAGPDAFQEIMKSDHGILHRYNLLLQACITEIFPSKEDLDVLRQAGLGVCLLDGLPDWTIKYAAGVMRFLNEERQSLPKEILKTILFEKGMDEAGETEAFDAEIQADGVFNTRLQNLAITLDKVRYIFKKLYGDPKCAPSPLRKLDLSEVVALIWKDKHSIVAEVLHGMAQHTSKEAYSEFMLKVHEHEPLESGNTTANLRESLLWLRDELCKASITYHDAAADLVHLYAHTELFFSSQDYPTFESPPLKISPLDLGPKHAYNLGAAPFKEWRKMYSKDYVLGQLIFWYKHNESEPGVSLVKSSRGCLINPSLTSCYGKSPQHQLSYDSMGRRKIIKLMEHKSQRQWNWNGQCFWEFKESLHLLGSPIMDAVHTGKVVNKETMNWLKRRRRAV